MGLAPPTMPRFLSQDYKEHDIRRHRAMLQMHPEWIPKEHKGNIDAYIKQQVADEQAAQAKWSSRWFPEPLHKRFGMNADLYETYYRENLEFVRPAVSDRTHFDVDEEAKSVGPSNRRVEFLDRCVAMLEKKDKPDQALRLLKRYTNEEFDSAAEWRKWLDQNRSRLFFSDMGGYKFFVGPQSRQVRSGYRRNGEQEQRGKHNRTRSVLTVVFPRPSPRIPSLQSQRPEIPNQHRAVGLCDSQATAVLRKGGVSTNVL